MTITLAFNIGGTPAARLNIKPTNIKIKAIPNKWICETRAKDENDTPESVSALA